MRLHHTAAAGAALLLSAGAQAQHMDFLLEASQATVNAYDPSITIEVWATWGGDPVGFAGAGFHTLGVSNWETGAVVSYGGEFFQDDIFGDDEGQLEADNDIVNSAPAQLPPFFNDDFADDNPIHLFTVEWETTDFTPRQVCVEVAPYEGYVYIDEFGAIQTMVLAGDSLCFRVANCPGDFNNDGAKDTRDVLDFLSAWSAGDRRADWNRDGRIDTRDVTEFLNDWITAC